MKNYGFGRQYAFKVDNLTENPVYKSTPYEFD